jgi:hypothetical protein
MKSFKWLKKIIRHKRTGNNTNDNTNRITGKVVYCIEQWLSINLLKWDNIESQPWWWCCYTFVRVKIERKELNDGQTTLISRLNREYVAGFGRKNEWSFEDGMRLKKEICVLINHHSGWLTLITSGHGDVSSPFNATRGGLFGQSGHV